MDHIIVEELEEIYSDPMVYYYYKDKYLVDSLLEKMNDSQISVNELKSGLASRLLQKQWFKSAILSKSGGSKVRREDIEHFWPQGTLAFDVQVSHWGEDPKKHQKDKWLQTSRSGYNLVLQINLNQEHFEVYNSWLKPRWHGEGIFNCTCHPVSEKRITLGWIRIDLDFETNELLIEEIQTDWLRDLASLAKNLKTNEASKHKSILKSDGIDGSIDNFWKYYDYMQPIAKIWDELAASVAIWFAKTELQIQNIYMHSFESCLLFKDQYNSKPPRSIYTKLPKKMGFVMCESVPEFLRKEIYLKRYFRKAKKESVKWFKLEA